MLLQIVATLTVILCSLYYYFTRSFNFWKDRNVVGPKPLPFFGNVKEFTLRRKHIGMILQDLYNQYPNEKIVGFYRMTNPTLLIRDPEIVKAIMIKDFDVFVDRGFDFGEGIGRNLFHADGKLWRALRNRFTSVFTSSKLKNMLYLITERADHLIEHIEDVIKSNPEQEVQELVQKFTISSISACAFGLDVNTTKDKLKQLKAIDELIFTLNFTTELDMLYPNLLKKMGLNMFPNSLNSFFYDIVKNAIQQRNGQPTGRKDFIDLILELRQEKDIVTRKTDNGQDDIKIELTDDIIMAQTFVFYAGGYETSASTMGYMLRELALNPEVQNKLQAVIDSVLTAHDNQLTYEAIQEMKYLDKVIDETLRMYPILDPLQRRANRDYKIPGTDLVIKKGQLIMLTTRGMHWDPKYYPEPEKFNPDRFSTENTTSNSLPLRQLSFGAGPRICLGMRFALLQMKILIIKLLSKFTLEATKNTPREVNFRGDKLVLRPTEGYYMKIVPRKKTI